MRTTYEMRTYVGEKLGVEICGGSSDTPLEKLIEVAGTRWTVEKCFKESQSKVGLGVSPLPWHRKSF